MKIATAQSIQTKLKQGSQQIQKNKASVQQQQQQLQQFLSTLESEASLNSNHVLHAGYWLLNRYSDPRANIIAVRMQTVKTQQELEKSKQAPPTVDELIVAADPISKQSVIA